MKKMVDMINYEIEYVLRPVSAPIRPSTAPRLRTNRRARSSRPDQRSNTYNNNNNNTRKNRNNNNSNGGYPRVYPGVSRSVSDHGGEGVMRPSSSGGQAPRLSPDHERYQERPRTAPPRPRPAPHRSPTRPNYKEEVYNQSRLVLRYIGHPDHRARDRNYNIGARSDPMPAYLDEVDQSRYSVDIVIFLFR